MLFQTRNLSYLIRLVVILLSSSIYYLCANIRANICWYQLSGWLEKSFSERGAITDIYQLSLSEWHNHYFLNDIIPALRWVRACLLPAPAPSTLLTDPRPISPDDPWSLFAGDLAEDLWQHGPLCGGGHLQLRHQALRGARPQVSRG